MADRKKSNDGTKETDKFVSDFDTPDHGGRSGGGVARKVGSRTELNDVQDGGDDVERVRKSDEKEKG